LLYDTLCRQTGQRPAWGVLTGIRPAALTRRLLERDTRERVRQQLCGRYRVSESKADLALEVAEAARPILALNHERCFSMYISIPFCPSRCAYCSFVSKTIEREGALVGPYIERLCDDLRRAAQMTKEMGLQLMSVYIGGGTPGVLDPVETRKLLGTLRTAFPDLPECTFEAGRPDVIDDEKLQVLRAYGVTRISVNPQTGQDDLLAAVGRRHTAAETEQAFDRARRAGFDNINADLIAGLPGDRPERFANSLNWLLGLAPEHVTVHALTLKRASTLRETGHAAEGGASEMVDTARARLDAEGYRPYYLYRQKGTVEGLENVGYALPGYECRYNVFMMDEVHTVVGIGAGAVTKLVDPASGLIKRINNLKYPADYLAEAGRIGRILSGITDFYGSELQREKAGYEGSL